jgi:hypothetical protein
VLTGTASATVAACRYFRLDLVQVADASLTADTEGRSFHLLTGLAGRAAIEAAEASVVVGPRQTALVAGGVGHYRVRALDAPARLMRACVPV